MWEVSWDSRTERWRARWPRPSSKKVDETVHLAFGRSYPETGGKNERALHSDLNCDLRKGGRLTVDGGLFQEDGQFV